MAKTKPWLDYNGETTAELLACKKTHRIDSILCALEWGIQGTEEKRKLTAEERVVLSIMALDREVMNGGFDQFFRNSSRKHAPIIVKSLETVGSLRTAALAAKAIGALKLDRVTRKAVDADAAMAKRSAARDKKLNDLDQEYFAFYENEKKLFAFVEKNEASIECAGEPVPKPGSGPYLASALATVLGCEAKPPRTLASALGRIRQMTEKLGATELQITVTAHLYMLQLYARDERWDDCEPLGRKLIEVAGDESPIDVQMWVMLLINSEQGKAADYWATASFEYLRTCAKVPDEGPTSSRRMPGSSRRHSR